MSEFKKIKTRLENLGFNHERNSGNAHAIFRHGQISEFKLSVPCTPKSYGALNKPLKKAALFNRLLNAGLRYAETVDTNIVLQHKDDPQKVISIPSRPKGLGALKQALEYAEEVNAELSQSQSRTPEFNSKSERKAWRKAQWKPGYSAPPQP